MRGATSVPGSRRGSRVPLASLLVANLISNLGSDLTFVVIPWFVLVTTGSATRTGLTAAVAVLPIVVAGLAAGTLVDRLGFVRGSILSDLASALLTAAIPLLYRLGALDFAVLLALVFLRGLAAQPGATARLSLLPTVAELAGTSRDRANSLAQGTLRLALLFGPPLAGVLIAALGTANVLWLDASSFLVSAALYAAGVVPSVPRRAPERRGSYLAETLEGLRFLREDRLLFGIVGFAAIASLISEPVYTVLLPVYARVIYGRAVDLGLMYSSLAVGSLIGLALYGLLGQRVPRRLTVTVGFLVRALTFWVFLLRPPLTLLLASIALNASFFEPLNPLSVSVIQERTPEPMRGRVFGAVGALGSGTLPLGTLLGGLLIGGLGLMLAVTAIAAASLAQALSFPFLAVFRRLDEPVVRASSPAVPVDEVSRTE